LSSSKSTPISLPSVPARRFGLFGESVPSSLIPAAAAFAKDVYIVWLMPGGLFRTAPWPSAVSPMLTRAFRVMVASGRNFARPGSAVET